MKLHQSSARYPTAVSSDLYSYIILNFFNKVLDVYFNTVCNFTFLILTTIICLYLQNFFSILHFVKYIFSTDYYKFNLNVFCSFNYLTYTTINIFIALKFPLTFTISELHFVDWLCHLHGWMHSDNTYIVTAFSDVSTDDSSTMSSCFWERTHI